MKKQVMSFKPCYKWITFNTKWGRCGGLGQYVLNLVINGLPSILLKEGVMRVKELSVLNLVINGLPSIQKFSFIGNVL